MRLPLLVPTSVTTLLPHPMRPTATRALAPATTDGVQDQNPKKMPLLGCSAQVVSASRNRIE
jgi:hypothetical protein